MLQEMEGCKLKDNIIGVGEISQFIVLMPKLLEMKNWVNFSRKYGLKLLNQLELI